MANYKGTGIIILRSLFKHHGKDFETKFIAMLNPEEKSVYESVLPSYWVPIELAGRLFSKAADVLFPGQPDGLLKVGREQAINHLTGIYKVLLRITTVGFAVKQAALLWKTYFDQGIAQGSGSQEERKILLTVGQFPDLPKASRQVVAGYMMGVLELGGVRNLKARYIENNPQMWIWEIYW